MAAQMTPKVSLQRHEISLDDPFEPWISILVPYAPECEEEACLLGLYPKEGEGYSSKTEHGTVILVPWSEEVTETVLASDTCLNFAEKGWIGTDEETVVLVRDRRRKAQLEGKQAPARRERLPSDERDSTEESDELEEQDRIDWEAIRNGWKPADQPSVDMPASDPRTQKMEQKPTIKKAGTEDATFKRMFKEMTDRAKDGSSPFNSGDDIEISRATQKIMSSPSVDGHGQPVEVPAIYSGGLFWRYDNSIGVWHRIEAEEVKKLIVKAWWQHPLQEKKGMSPLTLSNQKVAAVLAWTMTETGNVKFFTESPFNGIGMKNGYLTIEDDQIMLLPPNQTWRCNSYIDAEYDPNAKCTRWLKYLEEATARPMKEGATEAERQTAEEDARLKRMLLQEFVGACVMGYATKYQKCLVVYGEGGNGKGVFTDVVTQLFDPKSIVSVPPQDWTDKFRPQTMVGARINIVSELPDRDLSSGDRFKAIVVGEAITVERKYGDPVKAPITCGHIFSCNALPLSSDSSTGYWRRFLLVVFGNRFDTSADRDIDLAQKIISQEIAGIAQWAMEGALRLQRNGKYTEPTETRDKLTEWRESSDPLLMFVRAATATGNIPGNIPGAATEVMTRGVHLYKVYKQWALDNGHVPLSSTKFGVKIKSHLRPVSTNKGIYYPVVIEQEYRHLLRDE